MLDPVELMKQIISKYQNAQKWVNAPLGDVKALSNTHIGDVGQDFVKEWCKQNEMKWKDSGGRQSAWDAEIQGATFEVKTATEDVGGNFQFNHIRHHRPYQALLCIGVAPDTVVFDAWRKGDVAEGKAGHLVTMDRGSSATFKLTKRKDHLRPMSEFKAHIDALVSELS